MPSRNRFPEHRKLWPRCEKPGGSSFCTQQDILITGNSRSIGYPDMSLSTIRLSSANPQQGSMLTIEQSPLMVIGSSFARKSRRRSSNDQTFQVLLKWANDDLPQTFDIEIDVAKHCSTLIRIDQGCNKQSVDII